MLSKRANVFYLEHVRVMQKDGRLVYLTEANDRLEQFVAIPDKNTAFILLGKGSSITDAAARLLSESNVIVGFCGSGGTPLFSIADITFLVPQDEYRPTAYAQDWMSMWNHDDRRLSLAKRFLLKRAAWDRNLIPKYVEANTDFSTSLDNDINGFISAINKAATTTHLLSAEASYAKSLYALMSNSQGMGDFVRAPGERKRNTPIERANSLLDHGNYLAYGYAAVCLHALGIPYFLPVLHGKTRRGALVFDVADLFKDWLVMPAAFEATIKRWEDNKFRAAIIERALAEEVLDETMTFIKDLVANCEQNHLVTIQPKDEA